MQLTPEQVAQFAEDGYLLLRGALTDADIRRPGRRPAAPFIPTSWRAAAPTPRPSGGITTNGVGGG